MGRHGARSRERSARHAGEQSRGRGAPDPARQTSTRNGKQGGSAATSSSRRRAARRTRWSRRLLLGPKTQLPCTPPPWGTLTAIKAATGEIGGRCRSAGSPARRTCPTPHEWGSIALGGPIVTAGGLVFTAGTLESAIYAFDVRTGRQLWKGTLPTSARCDADDVSGPRRATIRRHLRWRPRCADRPAAR